MILRKILKGLVRWMRLDGEVLIDLRPLDWEELRAFVGKWRGVEFGAKWESEKCPVSMRD